MDASNVMVVCDACGKPVRVKHGIVNGKKVRVCPKCGAVLDKAYSGKAIKGNVNQEEAPKKRVRKRAKKEEAAAETEGDNAE